MKNYLKYIIPGVIVVAIGAIFYNKVYVVKSTFQTIKPSIGELHVTIRGIGNVDAKNIYNITAQSGGKINEIFFDEGDFVKKGDLLLIIDSVDMPLLVEEAKASLLKAGFEASSSKESKEALEAQRTLIESTHARYKKLLEQKYLSQAEYDKAKSDLTNIDAQIASAKAKIASASSEELRLKKSIEALKEKLQRFKIYSPVDGYIISKDAELASYVLPSSTIFKIVDPKTLWIRTNIDERVASELKVGQKATINLRSKPNENIPATLQRVVATSNAVTLEREINVGFDVTPDKFYINEQAEVHVEVATYKDAIKIPAKLLRTYKEQRGVWVADGDSALFKPIEILAQNDNEVAVKSGISAEAELLELDISKKPLSNGMKIFR
ncbi:Secretion protein HlyD [Sulfurimonas denitrificans DSM 1251]|uniref:Secretion protein HlyD n=1 Tax=Sulfurimonas denitrificans (strain ATCC 33889 / DSM 1251) TaxID=326298 RepID=Q30QU2_SULDN|nr:efflux RND transporter periplasmic adaptor subunit [Sulfurimonas denitrificans]ABB44639.1 Secretion protein HlyD [Sulfurimonas denitrificans DSM 1251]